MTKWVFSAHLHHKHTSFFLNPGVGVGGNFWSVTQVRRDRNHVTLIRYRSLTNKRKVKEERQERRVGRERERTKERERDLNYIFNLFYSNFGPRTAAYHHPELDRNPGSQLSPSPALQPGSQHLHFRKLPRWFVAHWSASSTVFQNYAKARQWQGLNHTLPHMRRLTERREGPGTRPRPGIWGNTTGGTAQAAESVPSDLAGNQSQISPALRTLCG